MAGMKTVLQKGPTGSKMNMSPPALGSPLRPAHLLLCSVNGPLSPHRVSKPKWWHQLAKESYLSHSQQIKENGTGHWQVHGGGGSLFCTPVLHYPNKRRTSGASIWQLQEARQVKEPPVSIEGRADVLQSSLPTQLPVRPSSQPVASQRLLPHCLRHLGWPRAD